MDPSEAASQAVSLVEWGQYGAFGILVVLVVIFLKTARDISKTATDAFTGALNTIVSRHAEDARVLSDAVREGDKVLAEALRELSTMVGQLVGANGGNIRPK